MAATGEVGRRGRLVVAEDDPDQQEILLEVLEHEGYEVEVANSPLELVEKMARAPDAILLDMVGILGPQVVRALEALVVRPAVVLLSGDVSIAQAALSLKADAFLAKPYDLGELLSRLTAVLKRPRAVRLASVALASV